VGAVSGAGRKKVKRSYRPTVEALEALRLLSEGAATALPGLAAGHGFLAGPIESATPSANLASDATWDAALGSASLAGFLAAPSSQVDTAALTSGLAQLDRYLNRTWYRAGIPSQQHDDCTQAVYVTLLQNLGRDRFDQLVGDIGQFGIREVLSRETPEGPDFFRAIDAVKKRAQRERSFQALDDNVDVVASNASDHQRAQWRSALDEAIHRSLNPREAALIYATLQGETPMEIASQWGVAPKTVSNEKTRVIQKLRDALGAQLPD
jgi:RNA polymerase sigma factor (sigma-70 family)